MINGKNYIGGSKVAASGKAFTSLNPASGEVIWQGFESTEDEVNLAFEAAHAAYLKRRKLPFGQFDLRPHFDEWNRHSLHRSFLQGSISPQYRHKGLT